MGQLKNILAAAVLSLPFLSCGLPSYEVLNPPKVVDSDGTDYTLAFEPDTDTDSYVLAYKLYWANETSLISSDRSKINDEEEVEIGFDTLEDLDFIQMKSSNETEANGNYPDSSTDPTVNATSTVTLDFNLEAQELQVTGANNTSLLYRRAIELDSSGSTVDDDVRGIGFLSAEYDFKDDESYQAYNNSVTITSDSDGIDSDVYDLFLKSSRFYYGYENYDQQSLVVAVVAFSQGVSASASAIESIPVYLGNVTINPAYWVPQ